MLMVTDARFNVTISVRGRAANSTGRPRLFGHDGLAVALYLALARKRLLLRGRGRCGKIQIAKTLAAMLNKL